MCKCHPRRWQWYAPKGAPNKVFPEVMPSLYGAVYTLKFNIKKEGKPTFKVSGLSARYPDAINTPKDQWTHVIGLPVPEATVFLSQKAPNVEVRLETWEYGAVARIVPIVPYDQSRLIGTTVKRLHRFIQESGYQIAGYHEEEYLTRPDAKVVKTIIRYPVKKK